ncbi:DEAD/DEAH box helicase family protein [Cognataquiflexum aquatile]|uniref:DEAD/DEAH box helicase family protein n=1 Tax=Cognataquiflexum aquatile TaxID=2249427 RepID=UPI000DE92A6A|nr:DEAD/DEAH box helicase family protein [Cognataquiflexum aquatile]
MLKEVKWSEDRSYRTNSESEPIQFYLDGLSNSNRLDLLLGYFSSAAINVLALGFATFLHRGGTLRMVINNFLSENDKNAVLTANDDSAPYNKLDLSNIKDIKDGLSEYNKHFFECLAWLISKKRIQLVIIKPKIGKGISHFKSGAFYDKDDAVGFKASCNFTAFGLLENLEELDAYLSWENSRSSKMISRQGKVFENFFNQIDDSVNYLDAKGIETAIHDEFGGRTEQELLIKEKELLSKKERLNDNKQVKRTLEKLIEQIYRISREPRFPYPSGPREYQIEAYNNWVKNDYQGIFAMATGTGKTITSLNCLLEESKGKNYNAIILVPTITLVNQWEEEAKSFNFQEIIKVSSKENWEGRLATTLSTAKRIPKSFIVITTYASFVKDKFFKNLANFSNDTILIADEAHNIGSKSILARLSQIPFNKRIGLSATPKRIYDLEGSMSMERFFNDSEPYTYTFGMERAINEGILCKYYYHPHIVELTSEELFEYIEISKKLAKFFNKGSDSLEKNDIVEKLLLKRKRIIHKAENKLFKTISILKGRFEKEGNLNYTFIYVPEGYTQEELEEEELEDESIKIINQYTREIGKIDKSIFVNQFTSGMPDRDSILGQFKEGKIQVIASMKCLDEGVDIPRAEHAIFCSSTGNPRQFIQRRGRILRRHPDKTVATIHDLVVIPPIESFNKSSETFNLEKSLVAKELERVMYFASLSINPHETEAVFEEICENYDLNIYTIHNNLQTQ